MGVDEVKDADPRSGKVDSAFLERFNYLDKTGALDDLAGLRKENRELDTLINDATALFGKANVAEMLEFVIARILERFIPMHLAFLIEPPQGGSINQYCYRNMEKSNDLVPEKCFKPLKSFFGDRTAPADIEEIETAFGPELLGDELRAFDFRHVFPMHGIGGLYGLVLLGKKLVGDEYSDAERMYADRFIRFLSVGIQNSLHHESSITDGKTGLYNHYFFAGRVEQEIGRVMRHDERAGLVMIDIDHFKTFNDTWGHLAGDEVLRALAGTVKQAIRTEDVAARFGGEEFCVLVVDCDERILIDVAERIRLAAERLSVPFKGEKLSVTVSVGCCLFDESSIAGVSSIIERADRALYVSKASGRNRTTFYRMSLLDRAASVRILAAAAAAGNGE